jgi:cytochrome c oxidase assembly protein subunit 15
MLAHRLALGTAVATAVLIVFGGLVTNTGAALAVPDWPNTFGHNLFLYPWSRMVGGIFYEHSHRLLGATVGLLTLALATLLWRRGGLLRVLGVVAVATVIAQGVLGGLRVVLLRDELAMVHGPLAQAYFALVVALVYFTSSAARTAVAPPNARPLRALAIAAVAATYAQIILGALITHAGWVWLHIGGAVVVFAVVPVLTARARRTGDALAASVSRVLLALLGLQAALGIGAYLARFSPIWIPGEQATMLALPVIHRLVAGLILASTVVLAVRLNAGPISDGVRPVNHGVRSQRERGGLGEAAGVPQLDERSLGEAPSVRSQRERGGLGEAEGARQVNDGVSSPRERGGLGETPSVRSQRERGGLGGAEGAPQLK